MSDLQKIDDLDTKTFNPMKEKQWQFEKRMQQHHFNRGSRYPPFSIEPMPLERMRLEKQMTETERFLRKQWLQDQILSPTEPRYVPALHQRNIIRRIYTWPLDQVFRPLLPVLGREFTTQLRVLSGRVLIFGSVLFWWMYHLKFDPQDWHKPSGWYSYGIKPVTFDDTMHKFKDVTTFAHGQSFAHRNVLLDSSKNSGPFQS